MGIPDLSCGYGILYRLEIMVKTPVKAHLIFQFTSVVVDPAIGEAGDVDTAVITLKMEIGAIAVIDNSRKAVYGYDQRAEVFGSRGMVATANDTASSAVLSNADGITGEKPLYFFLERYMESFSREVRLFVEAIEKDTETPLGVMDGLKPVLMGIAAKRIELPLIFRFLHQYLAVLQRFDRNLLSLAHM